jgi:hypothetical protein
LQAVVQALQSMQRSPSQRNFIRAMLAPSCVWRRILSEKSTDFSDKILR